MDGCRERDIVEIDMTVLNDMSFSRPLVYLNPILIIFTSAA